MKFRLLITTFIVLGILLASCSGSPAQSTPIKIGAIYNLTGGMASLDVPSANGAKLAAEEINTAGGVLGRKIDLIVYDGKTDASTIGNSATQLVETDKVVAMLGFSDTDMALAAAPIAAKAGVMFVTSGATSPRLPSQVPDYLFLACFGDNVQAAAGAEFSINSLKAKTAYLLIDKGTEYTLGLGKYFKERFTEMGGQIVLEDTYQTGDKDYSAQITKVNALPAMPDFLYISSGPDEVGVIVKQFRDAGIDKPIMGGDGYDTPLLVQIAGKGAENVYFSTHSLMDAQIGTDPVKKFIAAYQKKFNTQPENAFAGLGYDTVKLIADAIQRAGSDDPKAIREALGKTSKFPGVTGSVTYPAGVRIPQKGVTMILVKDGKFTLAGEVVPEKVPAP
ncbi:MAG: ABC transporter substrate-binding protein [Chloroflexota bacterium]|jgi:branched-chain amino acid transport system substrate-binding protein